MAGSGGRPENPEPAQSVCRAVGVRWPSASAAEALPTVQWRCMGVGKETRIFAISV
jgi:hypothetical protein